MRKRKMKKKILYGKIPFHLLFRNSKMRRKILRMKNRCHLSLFWGLILVKIGREVFWNLPPPGGFCLQGTGWIVV
jgi:hypothetical protein